MAEEENKDHIAADAQKRFNTRLRRLPKIRSGITLVFIEDSNSLTSLANKEETDRFTDAYSHCNSLRYANISKWIKYMKQARSYEHMILILVINDLDDNDKGISSSDIDRINKYQQVQSVFIIYRNNKINHNDKTHLFTDEKTKIEKLAGVFSDYQSASPHLQQLIDEAEQLDDGSFATFNRREKSLKDVHQDFIEFLSTHTYRVILKEMPYKSSEAKRQMFDEIDAYYRGKPKQKPSADLDRFNRTYNSSDAINWYTRSGFLYQIVNRALRTEDIRALYIFRYFIMDLSACLKELTVGTRARYNTPFRCYRGSRMSREELEQWDVNMLVATNTFWSSSLDERVAKIFVGIDSTTGMSPSRSRDDKIQYVLFEIDIDFTHSASLIIADVSHLSAFEVEHEMLFDLGTPLFITSKTYDEEHLVWRIQMTSTSEIDALDNDYISYVYKRLSQTNGPMLYGNLLAGALCDFKEAVTYFQRLLRVLPINDESRPNIYCELGRVYRFMGKYQQAIEYFRAALLLQKRRLPQSKFDYGSALSGLAVVYSKMGELKRAIRLNKQALDIYHTIFPDEHIETNQILDRLAYDLYQSHQYQQACDLLSKVDIKKEGNIYLTNSQTQLYYTLGLIHKACYNRSEALEYLTQALKLREKWSHKNHPYTARICHELSLLYADEDNQKDSALEYAQRALYIRRASVSSSISELEQSTELVKQLSQSDDST